MIVAVLAGLSLILVAATFGGLGGCAFGGRCHADRPPLLDDDIFRIAAYGGALLVAVPVFLSRPSKRRLLAAVAFGGAAAFVAGLVARTMAYG